MVTGKGPDGGPGLELAVRVYRALLGAYPREFRRKHGREMQRFFRDRAADARREGGSRGLAGHCLRAFWDLAVSAWAERREGRRSTGGGGGMEGLGKDVRWALRSLARAPVFTAVAVVTIALGIGANTAIFSVVRGVLLRPLPYPEPQELVLVWGEMTNRGVTDFPSSPPDLQDFRRRTTAFEGVAGFFTFEQPLTGDFEPQQLTLAGVTTDFFDVVGVRPEIGRSFVPSDGDPVAAELRPGDPGFANAITVLSHHLWQQRFGGDPSVLGRIVEIAGQPAEIVGVMPRGFRLVVPPSSSVEPDPDAFVALRLDYENAPRNNVFLHVLARLRTGATVAQAQAELDEVAAHLRDSFETWATSGYRVEVVGLHEDVTEQVRPFLVALLGAVGFVLLIACANVSNLLLVRASTRERELAVRAAMGGSRLRLVRQLLAESTLLAGLGGLLGAGLAVLGVRLLLALRPEELPRLDAVGIDGTVLAFTALASLGAAVLFGLLPSLQASRVDLASSLKERGASGGLGASRLLRNGVVVVEVALTVVLLVGAGLMVRSFAALSRVDPGLEPEGVLTFEAALPFFRYATAGERSAVMVRLQERLAAVPSVEAVSAGLPLPLEGVLFNGRWGLEEALTDPSAYRQADYHGVLPGFFEVLGTELLEGRALTHADNADSAAVVVVDRKLADIAFPGESAVGRRIVVRVSSPEPQWVEIVGVVENQRNMSLVEEGRETVYFPERMTGSFGGTWAVRTSGDPLALVPGVRSAVAAVDPNLAVDDIRPMTDFVREGMAQTRFALILIGVFAGIALVLSAVGLYGVLSYVVRQRTSEIGVRMAFGAETGSILRLVVGQGLALVAVGLVAGLAAALGLTGLMASFLVDVRPNDPATFAAIGAFFLLVGAAACALPARRASRIDPVEALQGE